MASDRRQAGRKWLTAHKIYPLALLLIGLLLRGTIAVWLPPGFDEGYYYLYTQHLDWSYFDHPLLVALTTGMGPWLTGNVSQFTIRLGALLLHTGALFLLYLTAVRLFSFRAALLTLTIASIAPIFLLGFGVLTLPDSPLMFFWTAALFVAASEFFRRPTYCPSYRLAILGLLVGLACLSKYHGLALGFGLVGFCLTSSRHRSALSSPWMLAGVGLFTLAVLPIVIWNVQHDWVSLRFQSGRAIPDRGYSLLDLLVTFLAGAAYLFPTIGLPLWWVSGRALLQQGGKVFSKKVFLEKVFCEKQWLILWVALPLMLGFTAMGGYRSILPTWAMPGFWTATLLLGERAAHWQQQAPRLVKRWLWGSAISVASLLLVALLHVTIGVLQKPSQYALFGGVVPANADASVQLIDIHQVRKGFVASEALMSALSATDFLFTNDLYLAGQLGMALHGISWTGGTAPVHPKPITCFDADLRGFAFWSTRQQWVGQRALLVTVEQRATADVAKYSGYFSQIDPVAEIPIYRGGTIVQRLQVFQCSALLKPYPRPYGL